MAIYEDSFSINWEEEVNLIGSGLHRHETDKT